MFYIIDYLWYLFIGAFVIALCLMMQALNDRRKGRYASRINLVFCWCMGEYLVMLFALTVSPIYGWSFPHINGTINSIPFQALKSLPDGLLNFAGNILMFIPMGIFLRILIGRRGKLYHVFWGTVVSILIETIQLFTTRGTDIDDVMLNTLGTIIGWLIGYIIFKYILSTYKVKKKRLQKIAYGFHVNSLICISLAVVMVVGFVGNNKYIASANSDENLSERTSFQTTGIEKNDNITIAAKSGILICTDNNQMIWSKDCRSQTSPASCSKLVNALTVLKYCKADEVITVGNEINKIASDSSRSYLSIGVDLTVRQALIAMLLPSGNDAAYSLAVYTGQKIAANNELDQEEAICLFEKEMNETAKDLGAVDSFFCSPDGYDIDGQYTTAYDLAIIGKAAMDNKLIAEIVGMEHSEEEWTSGETGVYDNTNELLQQDSPYYVSECTGLKTGTSKNAGACLVMSFTIQGKHYVGVIMGSTEEKRFEDSICLYNIIGK